MLHESLQQKEPCVSWLQQGICFNSKSYSQVITMISIFHLAQLFDSKTTIFFIGVCPILGYYPSLDNVFEEVLMMPIWRRVHSLML